LPDTTRGSSSDIRVGECGASTMEWKIRGKFGAGRRVRFGSWLAPPCRSFSRRFPSATYACHLGLALSAWGFNLFGLTGQILPRASGFLQIGGYRGGPRATREPAGISTHRRVSLRSDRRLVARLIGAFQCCGCADHYLEGQPSCSACCSRGWRSVWVDLTGCRPLGRALPLPVIAGWSSTAQNYYFVFGMR